MIWKPGGRMTVLCAGKKSEPGPQKAEEKNIGL